jgi:hypothetical protein
MTGKGLRRIALAGLLTVLVAGCASPDIGRFATAAEKVVGNATAAYGQVDTSTLERKLAEVAANAPELPVDETFEPILSGRNLTARMGLLRSLGTYAKGLRELNNASTRPRIDRAAKSLEKSLREVNRGLADSGLAETGIAQADLALLTIAVRRLGAGISEIRRRQAIHTAVKVADPAIHKAAALLSEELPLFGDLVEANLAAVETELLAAYRTEAATLSFPDRMERLREIYRQRILRTEAKAFFATVGRAAGRLGEAHAAQKMAFDLDDLDLPALSAALTELEQAEADIQAFRERWQAWREKP